MIVNTYITRRIIFFEEIMADNTEILASDVIYQNTIAYAKHILSNTFPCPIDGLKRVKRRIIYTQPRDEKFGGQLLISNTIKIHPYSDMSIYEAACRMTDTFRYAFPLLRLIGGGNSYAGDKAASARYTKFALSDFCKDVFFNGINLNTLPMEMTEDLTDREIQYFIPKIPTALLISNESIGFGYSSRTLPLKFENICDIAIDYVKCTDKLNWDYRRLARLFVPCIPLHLYIRNEKELIQNYRDGRFNTAVVTEGHYVVESNNTVLVRTLSHEASPSAIYEKVIAALKDKNHWLAKSEVTCDALSESINYVDFRFTIKRGGNIFELIDHIKGLIRLRSPSGIINNFVFNEKMLITDPPSIVMMWYKERYRSIFGAKKHRQQDLQKQKFTLETYLVVCEYIDEVIKIIRQDKTRDEIFEDLKTRFDLTLRQCEILVNTTIQMLMRSKRNELEDRLTKTIADLDELNASFNHIDDEICAEIKYLKKKYKTDMTYMSRSIRYIGALIIGSLGIYQVTSFEEVIHLSKLFNNVSVQYIPYNQGDIHIFYSKSNNPYTPESTPLTIAATSLTLRHKTPTYIFFRTNGKSLCVKDDKFSFTSSRLVWNYVSHKPKVIKTDGTTDDAHESLFDNRSKSIDVLYAFDSVPNTDEYIALSVNTAHPNVIRCQRFTLGEKLMFSGAGETAMLAVIPSSKDDVIVNLPEFHKHSLFHLTGLGKLTSKTKLTDVNTRSLIRA